MRVAVSDYDGTMRRDDVVSARTLAAIIKWRESGNRFGIATGRDLYMTLHETRRWNIAYDFLICLNGAAIHDHDDSLLQGRVLDDGLVPVLLQHPAAMASMHYQLHDDGIFHLFLRGSDSWLPSLGLKYTEVNFDQALAMKGLRQISFAYIGREESSEWTRILNEDLGARITAHQNNNCIDITPAGVDKATGVADMLALKEWTDADEVMVIGDGENDLAMIRRFHGHTVTGASPKVKKAARRVYADVADMLELAE